MTKRDEGITFLAPDAAPPEVATRTRYTRWAQVRDQLAANPNVWAVVLEAADGEPGYNSFHGKRKALTKSGDVEAEVRTENGVRRLYARHIA
jgi:hypothetical protein